MDRSKKIPERHMPSTTEVILIPEVNKIYITYEKFVYVFFSDFINIISPGHEDKLHLSARLTGGFGNVLPPPHGSFSQFHPEPV